MIKSDCDVYLAGTIYDEEPHKGWKRKFMDIAREVDSHKVIDIRSLSVFNFYDPNPSRDDNIGYEVISRDKSAIEKSDVLVAYINKISIGTAMEIKHAFDQQNITIIVINPAMNLIHDLWLTYHSHQVFIHLEEAALFLKDFWNRSNCYT